ncbi:slc39a-4 [Sesbania bispinosa]|nr:slc39a-4 [Sesbania bispinosa]
MAKSLKIATVESAWHSHKLTLRRFQQGSDVPASSVTKMRSPKGKGSKDYPNGDLFESSLDHPQPLERADFVVFWLSSLYALCGVFINLVKTILEYCVQGWFLGRPLQSLVSLIDDEGSFVFRLYTSSFFPGVEGMDMIYLEPSFSTRNNKGPKMEGVFDFWLLCIHPRILPELDPLPLHEAVEVVLFVERHYLSIFNSSLFVPVDRVGHVLDEWVVYQQRLKASVTFYESVKSASPPHKILIMYKDPYYVTSITVDFEKSYHDALEASSKKRKSTSSQKRKARVPQNVSNPSTKRFYVKTPPVVKHPFSQVITLLLDVPLSV